jgi:curved DNA-binding protein CbpA
MAHDVPVTRDPHEVLGVRPGASPEELHDAYRRLVKLHHPDRNPGSRDAGRRFREIQEAYDELQSKRRAGAANARPRQPPPAEEAVEQRMADLERELREVKAATERARRAARAAMRDARDGQSDEDLGYVSTDDSFGKILGDVRVEVTEWLRGAGHHPAVRRVADYVRDLDADREDPERGG